MSYKRLSKIAWHVSSSEDAFDLICQAYGSVEVFFELLEEQRLVLRGYAQSCITRRKYMEGFILLYVAKRATRWGTRFKGEYRNLDVGIKYT